MGRQASSEEKERLIGLYFESGESQEAFTEKHGINKRTLSRWLKKYNEQGVDGLKNRTDLSYEKIAQNLTTEADLRKEILKLRIENERLKKNYMVETTEDGKTEYIRLKPRNTKL